MSDAGSRSTEQVRWLLRLRWAAIAAQLVSILGVRFLLHAPFDVTVLIGVVTVLVAANLVLTRSLRQQKKHSTAEVTAHLLLDVTALTVLLVGAGGAMNPFTTLYLLHVALAAILLPRRWSLLVAVFAVIAFAVLLIARPESMHIWHSAAMFVLHVRGMWVAFALTAGALWFFVDRVSTSLRSRESELTRAAHVAALGTLAAGTAHELNTPLGTVAILAAELSSQLEGQSEVKAQADKIRGEIRRCKEILRRMASYDAPMVPRVTAVMGPWLRGIVDRWRALNGDRAIELSLDERAEICSAELSSELLSQALGNVLDNAARAVRDAGSDAPIVLRATAGDGVVHIDVIDRGVGIAPSLLPRLGEPFVTTRQPGEGMGLGLFLTQAALAHHDRGAMHIDSGGGQTRVRLTIGVLRA